MSSHLFLQGKKTLVTREKSQARELCETIAKHGGLPIEVPLISFEDSKPDQKRDAMEKISKLANYDWIVLTSKNGVDFFWKLIEELGISLTSQKFAAIGQRTSLEIAKKGITPDFIPPTYVAESFLPSFLEIIQKDEKVLVLKGDLARDYISKGLADAGVFVEEAIIYQNKIPDGTESAIKNILLHEQIDIMLFTSPSTVKNFMTVVTKYQLENQLPDCVVVAIGPVTKKKAEQLGISVSLCPKQHTVGDMMVELQKYYENQGGINNE